MIRFPRISPAVLAAVIVSLALPLGAEAQGWSWIRKLSGPEYTKAVNGRVAFCVFGASCAELGGGSGFVKELITKDKPDEATERGIARNLSNPPRPKTQGQLGVVLTYGWDGKNLGEEIAGVNMLTIEDQFAVLLPWRPYLPRVFSIGVGFNRFSGNGIEGTFWRTSLIQTIRWRVDFSGVGAPGWYVEGGPKFSYFFTRLNAEDFGGTPEVGVVEGGEMGFSLFFRFGYRFNLKD